MFKQIALFVFTVMFLNSFPSIAAEKKIIQQTAPQRRIKTEAKERDPILRTPKFSSQPITKATEGMPYTYTVVATSTNAYGSLQFKAELLPSWLKFDPSTGVLSGTPSHEDIGQNKVRLTVKDGIASTGDEQSFIITVRERGSILKVFANQNRTMLWVSAPSLKPDKYTVVERINSTKRRMPASTVTLKTARAADIPIMSCLLRDLSPSISDNDLSHINAALQTYIDSMPPHEQTQIIDFWGQVSVLHPFTSDRKSLKNALFSPPLRGGGTAFFDAIWRALEDLNQTHRESLQFALAFTDGEDNLSTHSLNDILQLAKANSIPIFSVGVGNAQEAVMKEIARETGGLYFFAPTPEALIQVYTRIANHIDKTYIISYPTKAHPGDSVSVTLEYDEDQKTPSHQFSVGPVAR